MGIDPDPYTLRELWWMQEGKQDQEWQHTSAIMSLLHNLQCTKKSQMKPPSHFNPMVKKKGKTRLTAEQTTHALKNFLVAASGGNYQESKCRYVQNEKGAWVLESSEIVKKG